MKSVLAQAFARGRRRAQHAGGPADRRHSGCARSVLSVLAAWVSLICAWSVPAASAPGGQEALRKLLKLPVLQAQFSLRLDPELGYVIPGARAGTANEIQQVTRAMAGQSSDSERPADAEHHYRLYELYREAGDLARASNHLAKSVSLFRTLADTQADNANLLAKYGRTLDSAAKEQEAEVVLRRAVRLQPTEWRAWSALSQLLLGRAWQSLGRGLPNKTSARPEMLLDAAAKRQLSSTQLEKARTELQEALQCAERAVSLAPKETQPWAGQALAHAYSGMLGFVEDVLRGSEPDPLKIYRAMFPVKAQADLEQLARLTPGDPLVWAKLGLFRLLDGAVALGMRGLENLGKGEVWSSLSDSQRQGIKRSMTELENLGQSSNPAVAAPALEFLGAFQWTAMRDRTGAERNLRRAVELDPDREIAWDFLMTVLVDANRHEAAIAAAETRLKSHNTTRNRIAAAKAFDRAGRLEQAQAHLVAALQLEPNDYLANLSAAVVLMKRASDEDSLHSASNLLDRAGRVEGRPATLAEWLEWTSTSAIFYALSGDRDAARREFKRVLEADPKNQTAKDGLALVGP
jgi:tetratricopeptide (TPR) repeat protein